MAAWETLLTQLAATERATVTRDAAGAETWGWTAHLTGLKCSLQRGGGRRGSYDPGRHTAATWTLYTAAADIQEDDRVTVAGVPERFKVTFVHRFHYRGSTHHLETTLERLFEEQPTVAVVLAGQNGHG